MDNITFIDTLPSASTFNSIIDTDRIVKLLDKLEEVNSKLSIVNDNLDKILEIQ